MSEYKPSGKTYRIDSFEDLLDLIDEDNIEYLAPSVYMWLASYVRILAAIREKIPKETKGMRNTEIVKSGFSWIDDGKNDFLGVNIEKS